jgi:glycerol-3-phosphate dehydrogenase
VKHTVFPVPSSKGKGVLAVPTVYGNTLIGPNSTYVENTVDTGSTFQGLDYVREHILRVMRTAPLNKSIRNFAGLRPSSSSSDFIIEEPEDAKHFINVASIESPGLASAPAISEYVIEHFVSHMLDLKENPDARMTRKRPLVMAELTPEERAEKIRENPMYGRIICRCEQISEGEIVDCIHVVCGATTVKGVKKRVRPGMGRCQGGFCEPRVVEILARELHISPLEVVLDQKDSKILEEVNR